MNRFDSYGDGWSIGYLQILEDEAQTAHDVCSETASDVMTAKTLQRQLRG